MAYTHRENNGIILVTPTDETLSAQSGKPYWEAEVFLNNRGAISYRLNIHRYVNKDSFLQLQNSWRKEYKRRWSALSLLKNQQDHANTVFDSLIQGQGNFSDVQIFFGENEDKYFNFDIKKESIRQNNTPWITYKIDLHVHTEQNYPSVNFSTPTQRIDAVFHVINGNTEHLNNSEQLKELKTYILKSYYIKDDFYQKIAVKAKVSLITQEEIAQETQAILRYSVDVFNESLDYKDAAKAKKTEKSTVCFGSRVDGVFINLHKDVKEKGIDSKNFGWVFCPEYRKEGKWTYEGNQAFFTHHIEKNHIFECPTNICTGLAKNTLMDEFLWLKDNGYIFDTQISNLFGFAKIIAIPPKSPPQSYLIADYRAEKYNNADIIDLIKEMAFEEIKDESKSQMKSKLGSLTEEEKKEKEEYYAKDTYYFIVYPPPENIQQSTLPQAPPPQIQTQYPIVHNIKFSYTNGERGHVYYLAGGFNGWLGKIGKSVNDIKINPIEGVDDQWKMQYSNDTTTWDCEVRIEPGSAGKHYDFNIYDAESKLPLRTDKYKLNKSLPSPPGVEPYHHTIS